ncbi:MAG: tetratricopeptide repeat protein [bacterium]|nr:tetratricopeptide repeat protein [bacterium]
MMAKRKKKKLNKRLVIILSIVTVLFLLLGGAVLYKFRHSLIPRDPVPYAKAGLKSFEQKQYKQAVEEFSIAISATTGKDAKSRAMKAEYYYRLGEVYRTWATDDKELTESLRRECIMKSLGSMRQAATLNREYVEPQKALYNLHWGFAFGQMYRGRANVDWTQFIEAADALKRLEPDNAEIYYRRGVARGNIGIRTGDTKAWKKGLADYREAIKRDTDNVDYWKSWLGLMRWAESRDPTINLDTGFAEAFKAVPDSAALRILYAAHLRGKDRSDEAEEQLRAAIKCEPTSPYGHVSMAEFLLNSEQYDAAIKELQKAEKIDRTVPAIYMLRSRIHRVGGKLNLAIKALQNGLTVLEPEHTAAATSQPASQKTRALIERMNRLNFTLASTVMDHLRTVDDKKQRADMLDIVQKCYDKLSTDNLPVNSPHLAKLSGRLAMIRGDRKTAIKDLEKAYEAFGLADLQTPALLITLYNDVGMPGKSEKLLLILQNAPGLQKSVDVMLALARLKMRYNDYEAADNFVNRAIRTDAQNPAALQLKNELRLLMGGGTSGVDIRTVSAAGIKALIGQADMEWIDGRQKEALARLTGLRKTLPGNLALAERVINMHLLLGDKDSAKLVLQKVLALHPDNKNLAFQSTLIDKTPDERVTLQLARIDKTVADPFARAISKARITARAGKKELYEKFFAEAVALKPDAPGIIAAQFRTEIRNKNWDAAMEVAKRVEKTDMIRGKSMRAELFVRQGLHKKAIDVLLPLRKENPDSKFVLRTLGESYLATKQFDQAGEVFGVLESNDPGDAYALIGLAIVAQQQGRLEENEDYVTRAYRSPAGRRHPYISARYLEIRESKATGDDIQDIIKRREKAHKAGSKHPNYLNNLARLAALCEYRTRDLKRAEELYREAYQNTGHSLQWGRVLAFFYARRDQTIKGEAILKTGIKEAKNKADKVAWSVLYGDFLTLYNPKKALWTYNQASTIDPENPLPFRAMAELYARQRDWSRAIENMSAYVARRGEDIRGQKTLIQYRINGRDYDKAEKALDKLLDRNPSDAQGLLLKAVLFNMRGNPAKAVAIATQAIEKHPEFVAAFSIRARAYSVMGELGMAKNDLETARNLSKTPQTSMELADMYMRLGRENDAISTLKTILAEYKNYENAHVRLINIYLRDKKWASAERSLSDARKLFPKQARYLVIEGEMWKDRQQIAKAVTALEKAFELDKKSAMVARAYLLGLLDAKMYTKASSVIEVYKTNKIEGSWLDAISGRIMVSRKQENEANALFLKAVEKASMEDASQGELFFVVSQVREAHGSKIAIERIQAWSKQRPADWKIRVLLGNLCSMVTNDLEEKLTPAEKSKYLTLSIENYIEALKNAKKSDEIAILSNYLGKAYYDKREYKKAIKAYEKCLSISPGHYGALNNLAYLYVEDLNDPKKALPYARKVIRLMPQDANVLDTYGWVLARLKKYSDAKKYLQRSIERDPELVACRYHLGWVFEQTGDRKRAVKHYSLGVELVRTTPHLPLFKKFQDALKRLGT